MMFRVCFHNAEFALLEFGRTPSFGPAMMSRTTLLVRMAVLVLTWAFVSSQLSARPPYKKALADYFGSFLAKKLNDCRTCHLPDQAGQDDDDKPHNAFGERLKVVRKELGKAGKTNDLAACLDAIINEESDGDGASNLAEILAGRNPGEKDDKPTVADLEAANAKMAAFRKFREGYRWQPFHVVKRPPVPQVKNAAWIKNPIDAFIAAEHEERGLKARPEVSRPLLVRRVYLDLTGLPPTREELSAAVGDPAADWYEKVVDQLLASPRYGERWARHWMDIWRYSDWHAFANDIRFSQPHIYRWRDWIVESLNDDKGYDRMILEMLAGDEIAPDDPQIVRATGFLARNYNILDRNVWMQDAVNHTFQGFLGLTINCARCHDHMYDPISHKEFYQVRAIFEPYRVRLDAVPGSLEKPRIPIGNGATVPGDGFVRVFDADAKAPTYLFTRGDETMPDKAKSLPPGVPAALGGRFPEIVPVKMPASVYDPEKREFVVNELVAAANAAIKQAQEKLAKADKGEGLALAEAEVELAKGRHAALVATLAAESLEDAGRIDSDEGKKAAAEAVRTQRRQAVLEAKKNLLVAQKEIATGKGADFYVKKAAAAEKQLAKAEMDEKAMATLAYVKRAIKTYPPESTGRRLAFARWIADTENPLTARVAINHMWLRHFGQGLAANVSDLGSNGGTPSHPALLDWLASELMEPSVGRGSKTGEGWSMKHVHRLMVTSATYRMASTSNPANVVHDPDNQYLWRMTARRMEAEVVRDSLFHLSGSLDLTMGGIDIEAAKGMFVPRRSIYFHHAQDHQMDFLKVFDIASVNECYQRNSSVMPQQALALANSDLAIRQSRSAARKLHAKIGADAEAFVAAAFELVLSRPPSTEEAAECASFLREQSKLYGVSKNPTAAVNENMPSPDPIVRSRENLVRVLMNHNDFVTIR